MTSSKATSSTFSASDIEIDISNPSNSNEISMTLHPASGRTTAAFFSVDKNLSKMENSTTSSQSCFSSSSANKKIENRIHRAMEDEAEDQDIQNIEDTVEEKDEDGLFLRVNGVFIE